MSESQEGNEELEGLTIRRAYTALIFGAPWGLIVVGVGLILFGLLAHRPTAILVTAIGFGAIMAVIGCLALRISGPIELSHKGFKGHLDTVPTGGLVLARSAADKALSADEPDRTERIETAARQAVLELLSSIQANQPVTVGISSVDWLSGLAPRLVWHGGRFFTVPGISGTTWEPRELSANEPGDEDRDAQER